MNRERYAQENTFRMAKILKSSAERGLSEKEATARLCEKGINRISQKRESPALAFLRSVIYNGSLPLFLSALLLTAPFLQRDVLFPSVLYFVFLCVLLLLFVLKERLLRIHETALLPYVRVMRDGKVRLVSPESLVEGDLILLSEGDVLYTYAHITTDAEIEVVCDRGGRHRAFVKHGGHCFEDLEEPFNFLAPGDMIRSGQASAFVTGKCEPQPMDFFSNSETLKARGDMCKAVTRITYFLSFALFAFGFFKACALSDAVSFVFLGECVLLSSVLIATASTAFYPLLFELLFLIRNLRGADKNGNAFATVSDLETVAGVDSFVLSTKSLFSADGYDVRYFETASGRRVTGKMRATPELMLIADALFATKRKCKLAQGEEAVLDFCGQNALSDKILELCAKTSADCVTFSSYHRPGDSRGFSLVWGDAERLIPELLYVAEDGKTRLLEGKRRDAMMDAVCQLKRNGYTIELYAETQTKCVQESMPQTFAELRLLGFFALRRYTDEAALRTLAQLEGSNKKVLFVHDGESVDWIIKEIQGLDGVPVLDGASENFRSGLTYFTKEEHLPICIGVHLSPKQKAQVVAALEATGRSVAVSGTRFDDYRMMYDATVAVAPLQEEAKDTPPLVVDRATVRSRVHASSFVGSVQSAVGMLGAFGIFTVALCASLLGRAIIVLLGALLGNPFLACGYYALFGILFDLLALICFGIAERNDRIRGQGDSLLRANNKNFSLFAGFVAGSVATGLIAAFLKNLHLQPESFVFVSLLLMLNVGLWYFFFRTHASAIGFYSLVSFVSVVSLFLLGTLSGGRYGFDFEPRLIFWALIPVVVMLLVGKVLEFYFIQKINDKVGENNE